MRAAWLRCLPVVILCHGLALADQTPPPELDALLHIGFDDSLAAAAPGAELTVTGGEGLQYEEGKVGKAARFGEGNCVEYSKLPDIDTRALTIEFWVKPDFDNRNLQDHYFLRFLRDDASSGLDFNFAQTHCGPQAVMQLGKKKYNAHGDFRLKGGEWNHYAVTWDTQNPELGTLRLYHNGRICTWIAFHPLEGPQTLRVGCKSADEGLFANALIDEVYVYNRCLTEMQVKALYENALARDEKLSLIREKIATEDAENKRRHDLLHNERKVAMVIGRTIIGWKDDRFTKLRLPVPEQIHETKLETTDLSQYDMLFFPGGGGFVLSDAGKQALQDYVSNGGGFVGVCAGCYAAGKYGLLERRFYPFQERGRVAVTLKPHPITDGYNLTRKLYISHANGPFIDWGTDHSEVPILYQCGDPPFGCTVAKQYGKGRVVAFSAHPEASNETWALLRNSFYWAAKIIGADQQPTKPDQTPQ